MYLENLAVCPRAAVFLAGVGVKLIPFVTYLVDMIVYSVIGRLLCFAFSITVVLWNASDFSSLVYFVILGCIGGMGLLLGICIVVKCQICFYCST